MKKAVTIRIKESTRERIKNLRTVDDTLDSLINTALDCLERRRRRCGTILEGGIVL
jgi:hypothetical protein